MASTLLSKEKQAIAQNLIETCGLQRAFHAAQQFGWHDIANSIFERMEKVHISGTRH